MSKRLALAISVNKWTANTKESVMMNYLAIFHLGSEIAFVGQDWSEQDDCKHTYAYLSVRKAVSWPFWMVPALTYRLVYPWVIAQLNKLKIGTGFSYVVENKF